jgi:hypothetical protein
MSKTKKILIALGLAGAVGISYAISTLRGFPEAFELDGEYDDA